MPVPYQSLCIYMRFLIWTCFCAIGSTLFVCSAGLTYTRYTPLTYVHYALIYVRLLICYVP